MQVVRRSANWSLRIGTGGLARMIGIVRCPQALHYRTPFHFHTGLCVA